MEGLEVLDNSNSVGPETEVSMYSINSEQSSTYTPILTELVDHPGGTRSEVHVEVQEVFQGSSGNLETGEDVFAPDYQYLLVNSTRTSPEDL